MRISGKTLVNLFVILLLFLFSRIGILTFNLWAQVEDLKETKISDIGFLSAHFLRYLLVKPVYILSDLYQVEADTLFTFLNLIFLVFIANLMLAIAEQKTTIEFTNPSITLILAYGFMISVATQMNGRLMFAILGFCLLVFVNLAWELSKISTLNTFLINIVALVLLSVSSGTLLSGLLFLTLWVIGFRDRKLTLGVSVGYLVVLLAITPLLVILTNKVLKFHGGWLNILTHGVGNLFFVFDRYTFHLLLILILVFLLNFGLASFLFLSYVASSKTLIAVLVAGISMSFVGYSGFTVTLPTLVALGLSYFRFRISPHINSTKKLRSYS